MSVVGIDLGTTNTVVACVRSGKVHVLADEHGLRLLPSVVSFHPNGEILVGAAAKARRIIDPTNTVYSHKRLIGRSWGSPEIVQAKSRFAFELKEGPGQGPLIRARGQDYTLPEISAFVLKRTRQIAETALGTPVERAVITVPAHFNELQRASTKVAGRVSGLEVLRILNEPTAAALAYGLGRAGNERVAVYDFGGGTFDCTLLDLNGNVFEVLATAGDSFLGGDDIDSLIAERMAETYLKAYRYDPRTDAQMLERLKTTAEDVKMVLSTAETHSVVLKDFGHGSGGGTVNFTFTMTRRDLEHMVTPLVDRSFKVTQDALALARLTPTSFDKIILVGGSTRMPLVRKRVEAFFGQTPLDRVNPDEVVAIGAAIQAAALTEGARRRSIPAPPAVIGKPRTLPGVQSDNEADDDTQTSVRDTAGPPPGMPAAAFGSSPPSFGFHPASSPPPAARSAPAMSGARAPGSDPSLGRKITSPGVAPATTPPTDGRNEDPSIASIPDLSVPTPFEWSPSGQPSAGGAPASRPRVGSNPHTRATGPGFGAIDEPPSMMSRGVSEPDAVTEARQRFEPDLDEETDGAFRGPGGKGGTVNLDPTANPARANRLHELDDAADLPSIPRVADLPAVAGSQPRGKRPEIRKPGKPGEQPPPSSRTMGMPERPVPPAPSSSQPVRTGPMPQGPPRTAPMQQRAAPAAAFAPPAPAPPAPPPAPPAPAAFAPPPAPPAPAPFAPPPVRSTFDSSPGVSPVGMHVPPAAVTTPFGFGGPPPAFGSAPPPPPPPPPPPAPAAEAQGYAEPQAYAGYAPSQAHPQAAGPHLGFAAPVLVDVTPRGLVVETAGGYTDTIIPRNAKIPCERTRRFATGRDMQTTVRVRVGQGEGQLFPQNTFLGEVELSGLRPAPRGEVVVAVTFEVDADGTLRVRARDVQTGQEARATLQLIGIADESSVVMMINRFAQQPVVGQSRDPRDPRGHTH